MSTVLPEIFGSAQKGDKRGGIRPCIADAVLLRNPNRLPISDPTGAAGQPAGTVSRSDALAPMLNTVS